MGADEKSNLQKCGEILINIKANNTETKIYTFNCSFCNANYDQLKNFSTHFEQKHFQELTEESCKQLEIFEPEVKIEELFEAVTTNVLMDTTITSKPTEVYENPLEINEIVDKEANTEESVNIKVEDGSHNINNEEMDCVEDNACEYTPSKKKIKKTCKTCNRSSDASSRDGFPIKDEKSKGRVKRKRYKKCEINVDVEDKEFIKALFQSFEKQKNLWNVKERASDKNALQKGFETVASEVNAKLNINISWNLAKIRINEMRIKYSLELEKQRKGEDHQIPWYFEHMKYLQENINVMIKERKLLDKSLLPILIEVYKKYNDLWQVNNICFGVDSKRDEAFQKIIDDLKLSHNMDMTIDKIPDYIRYVNHVYSKDKELQLKCELEKSEFIPTCEYYNDMSFLSESQGPFKCDICNEIIHRYDHYHIHVAKHHNTKPFKCPLCIAAFDKYYSYILHARRHLSVRSFKCNICNKGYPYKLELDRHLMTHTRGKPLKPLKTFSCKICGTSFRRKSEYDNHVRDHEKRYKCNVCGKEFAQGVGLWAHRKHHSHF